MFSDALILGGLGQVGTLLSNSLRNSGISVTLVDERPQTQKQSDEVAFLQSDLDAFSPALQAAILSSGCVCVCLPEKLALSIAARVGELMPAGSLWVDTLSVKSGIVHQLAEHSARLQILSINPMFAPVMGWSGGAVAVVELCAGPASTFFKELLVNWGARLEPVTAQEHDRLTAAIQVATHAAVLAFGAALLTLDFDLEAALRLASPPHRLLLTLLHRITTQSTAVYWDIQAYHPLASQVRSELITALQRIQADTRNQDDTRFIAQLSQLKSLLESRNELFTEWAKQSFALTRHVAPLVPDQ